MKHTPIAYGDYILLAASLIWGTAFYFQSIAMTVMGPYTFVTIRGLLATSALAILMFIRSRVMPSKRIAKLGTRKGYAYAMGGGVILALAMITQQVGIVGTTTGKAGFITTLYIVFVPLIGIAFRQRYPMKTWVALGLGIIGFFYLSTEGTWTSLNPYDALILLTAFAYGAQIYLIDQLKQSIDSMMFSFIQFGVATLLSMLPTLFLEGWDLSFLASQDALIALLYVGIVSSVIAYTLQVVGQKRSSSAPVASLMMSLEGIFATLMGLIFLAEQIRPLQLLGMGLIVLSILISQLSLKYFKEVVRKRK